MARFRGGRSRGGGDITFELIGDAQLQRELDNLTPDLREGIFFKATRDAGDVMQAALRAAAPAGETGKLQQSLRYNFSKKGNYVYVGLKAIGGRGRSLNYYATLISGRKPHTWRGVPRAGSPQMAGMFNFAGAAQGAGGKALDTLRSGIQSGIRSATVRSAMIKWLGG